MMWLINPEEQSAYSWGFNNALTDEGWKSLNDYIAANPTSKAEILNSQVDDKAFKEKKVRDTDITWISSENEISKPLYFNIGKLAEEANNVFFNYNLSMVETLQYSVYNAPTGHYDWHIDAMHKGQHGLTRKISFSIGLNDPSEYEGGELIIGAPGLYETSHKLEKNQIVFFNSIVTHKVTPVTKGVRKSLVGWIKGPNFV
ncbi:MAG: hypothetical protein CBB96_05640 [Gammaproteobacteria bacterium TMED36]|nr:MAG: hypothetical protein CBB96_05640 [Gammaproteobacteria bacterium TMED36]